jgi:curved DNA-binding protein CbpA
MDLYQTLGVDRSASAADIRRAYRRRAKSAHPDAGGSPEAFNRLHTALSVLSDDARRQRYDTSGEFDEGAAVDNTLSSTLQMVSQIIDLALGNILRSARDPRSADLLGEMREALRQVRKKDADDATALRGAKDSWGALSGRFIRKKEGANHFETLVVGMIGQLEIRLSQLSERKKWLDMVETMLNDYQYRRDPSVSREGPTNIRLADMMNRALGGMM